MSDTILKLYSKWIETVSATLSLDGVFIFGALLIVIAFVSLSAYKLASFDYEILNSSKNVIKFIRLPKSKRLYGSLNYYMRCFPSNISKAWENYFLTREGKPSSFLTPELASNYGAFEGGIKAMLPLVVAFSTLINLVFALGYKKLPLETTLIMPIVTLAFGIICIFFLQLIFNVIKSHSAKKYNELVRLLDFHALSDFASFLTPKIKATKIVEKMPNGLPIRFELEKNLQKTTETSIKSMSNDVVTQSDTSPEKALNSDQSSSDLEDLAVQLTLAKSEQDANEQTLNDAINNLMRTIACDNSEPTTPPQAI